MGIQETKNQPNALRSIIARATAGAVEVCEALPAIMYFETEIRANQIFAGITYPAECEKIREKKRCLKVPLTP